MAYAFRNWLSDAQRDALAPQFEAALVERMAVAATSGERLLAMRTLAGCAWSAPGMATLLRLLDGGLMVGDTPLAPRDRFALVERLLVRDHPEAAARLAFEAARPAGEVTATYAYAAGAARRDAATKARYLEQFLTDPALPEDWLEQGLVAMNAIEHAGLTAPLFERALAALPDLKRRHKIFFVNAWLSGFIGGQADAGSLAIVHRAASRAGLDADLRLKLLEFADALDHTIRIRAKYSNQAL
jgi:hypothetical protein